MDNSLVNPPSAAPAAVASDAPRWFAGMDRNGDGDISLAEFLGTRAQFKQLDSDGDGFIDMGEAKNASDEP